MITMKLKPALYLIAMTVALAGCGQSEPNVSGAQPDMRRLTAEQYRNTITDIFGETISIGGRFDSLLRTDGLLQVGARSARITPSGIEQYYDLARSIAAQVTNETNRAMIVPCQPAKAMAADDSCAEKFFSRVGRLLYRRSLTPDEMAKTVKAANEMATTTSNFYEGIAEALATMMVSPKFLFVVDTTGPDPENPGAIRLTDYAKASRLSFLLWNSTPDEALLTAAEKGELRAKKGLETQVERLLASDRLDQGVRAFFTDFLNFDKFDTLEKDAVIYQAFSPQAGQDAREQVLRTIIDHLITRQGDYRDLFTTRETFMTEKLGRIYRVPVERPDGGWSPYRFSENDPRAGLLSLVGITALNSHPGKSSPTLRGRAVREVLLCQHVPDPPGNVDFSIFNDPNSPNKTARDRLTAHRTAATCAGCHKITDPIGLGLETFDGAGQLRTTENGEKIDTSGDLDGVPFKDVQSLGKALHDSPEAASCVVNRLFAYGVGRSPMKEEKELLQYLEEGFSKDSYNVPRLLKRIALSNALYAVSKPTDDKQAAQADSASAQKDRS